jgi:hypothetical protein
MKIATYKVELLRADTFSVSTELTGTFARFGDEVICSVADREWPLLVQSAETAEVQLTKLHETSESDGLYSVVQVGNSFCRNQPDVSVVLDRGRHLAVILDRERANRLLNEESPDYVVRALRGYEIVFDFGSPAAKKPVSEQWIKDLVAGVSPQNVRNLLEHLVSFPTRRSTTEYYLSAARWAKHQFDMLGYATRFESISVSGEPSLNVIAEKYGHATGERHVTVVTGHLDSINNENGDPLAPAPGADDNGSGSAALLEIARVLSKHAGRDDLRFILFGGEEEGLRGSQQHVARLSMVERQRIKGVVNMDMVATVNSGHLLTVLLEGAPVSQRVIDGLAGAAACHTALVVKTSLYPGRSDHAPFITADIPAVLTIEGADGVNTNIHSDRDTLGHINYELLLSILRMNLAFVAERIGR